MNKSQEKDSQFKLCYLIPFVGLWIYTIDEESSGKELIGLLFLNALLLVGIVNILS